MNAEIHFLRRNIYTNLLVCEIDGGKSLLDFQLVKEEDIKEAFRCNGNSSVQEWELLLARISCLRKYVGRIDRIEERSLIKVSEFNKII